MRAEVGAAVGGGAVEAGAGVLGAGIPDGLPIRDGALIPVGLGRLISVAWLSMVTACCSYNSKVVALKGSPDNSCG